MGLIRQEQNVKSVGSGLVLFQDVPQAMAAEKILKAAGYVVRLVAPPPELRKGCDLAIEINLVEQPGIERILKQKDLTYVSIDPIKLKTAPLLDVVKITDFGEWIMVKAGNMKITYEKKNGIIVNVSGGGCPDIPYLHAEMIDKHLNEAKRPKDLGYTLCALNLDRAFNECLALHASGDKT